MACARSADMEYVLGEGAQHRLELGKLGRVGANHHVELAGLGLGGRACQWGIDEKHALGFADAAQASCTAVAEAFAVGQKAGVDLRQLIALMSAGLVNSGLIQVMAKTLDGNLAGMQFELNNARKDVRYYTHLAESLGVPTVVGEGVHQSLALACSLGYGNKFVPSLVEAQEKITGAKIVPR